MTTGKSMLSYAERAPLWKQAERTQALAVVLRALDGKPPRVTVNISPRAIPLAYRYGCPLAYHARIVIIGEGMPTRSVDGHEVFEDRAACEAHAIRVANGAALTFGKCRDWDRYEFAVVTQGTRT